MSKETITLPADMVGQRLDTILAGVLADVSRAQIQAWIKEGRITDSVTGKPIFQSSLKSKTPLTVIIDRPNKKPFEPPRAEDKPDNLHIVFEDDYLLVINKPSGIAVHPGAGRPGGTLVNMLLGHTELSDMGDQERPGIVHRLDKDTSGLMVVAKTNAVHAKLAEALQNRDVKRVYNALVWNVPKPASDTIETQIGRDPKNRQRMAVLTKGGKTAITHYTTLKQFKLHATLVECRLETGRTHQIRVHLAYIGCPVIGDPQYSGRHDKRNKEFGIDGSSGQFLHAGELSFIHPVTEEEMVFKADHPEEFTALIKKLIA